MDIEVSKLVVSSLNVRRNIGDISELLESIKAHGILEPIVVRPVGDRYEVIIGARRLAAAKEAGLRAIPADVREMTDAQALACSLVENLHRGDLQLEERVEAYKKLQSADPKGCGTLSGLAKILGQRYLKIAQDFDAYAALEKLRPHGIQIVTGLQPAAEERQRGEALPERHATILEQAFSAVVGELPRESLETRYAELARAIAPLEQEEARRVLDEFKKYPERPVSELRERALATVGLELTLDRVTARRLDELAEATGKKSPAEVISYLVERTEDVGEVVQKERKLVDEIDVGEVECPLCQKRLHLLHCKPTGSKPSGRDTHKVQEIVQFGNNER
jgi:ParB-like chromosome segregation protein Spo0J